jgi:hypothetical protein
MHRYLHTHAFKNTLTHIHTYTHNTHRIGPQGQPVLLEGGEGEAALRHNIWLWAMLQVRTTYGLQHIRSVRVCCMYVAGAYVCC